jgi:hypothetical protein
MHLLYALAAGVVNTPAQSKKEEDRNDERPTV